MCYVLRAADGGFVIVDSAMGDGVEDLIYRSLVFRKESGVTPTLSRNTLQK